MMPEADEAEVDAMVRRIARRLCEALRREEDPYREIGMDHHRVTLDRRSMPGCTPSALAVRAREYARLVVPCPPTSMVEQNVAFSGYVQGYLDASEAKPASEARGTNNP